MRIGVQVAYSHDTSSRYLMGTPVFLVQICVIALYHYCGEHAGLDMSLHAPSQKLLAFLQTCFAEAKASWQHMQRWSAVRLRILMQLTNSLEGIE